MNLKLRENRDESKTHYLKRKIKEYLQARSDEPVRLIDIRESFINEYHENFSHGMFSSAMRDLMDEEDGKIVNIDRGIYMYVKSLKKLQINRTLDETISKLKELAYVNYLELDEIEIAYIKEIPNLVQQIENLKIRY